jgi:predicted nucleic acid-binding Zn ribbon protein
MPLYDYRCSCGCIGKLISGGPEEILKCPDCGKKMNREIYHKYLINMDRETTRRVSRKGKKNSLK